MYVPISFHTRVFPYKGCRLANIKIDPDSEIIWRTAGMVFNFAKGVPSSFRANMKNRSPNSSLHSFTQLLALIQENQSSHIHAGNGLSVFLNPRTA